MPRIEIKELPVCYEDFPLMITQQFKVSNRVLEPVLMIKPNDAGYQSVLCGVRKFHGKEHKLNAQSILHNWVLDENVIRPLPGDIQATLTQIFESHDLNNLSFPDILAISQVEQDLIRIEFADEVFMPACESVDELPGILNVPGLKADLYEYQSRGVVWMQKTLKQTGGLILADEMGLGKTMQIISLLLLEPPCESSPALIICPTSLIANWRQEVFRFAPELSVMVHRGPNRTGIARELKIAQIVITTYDTAVNDISIISALEWSWVICDEAQAIKNPDSTRRKTLAQIPRRRTIPMTGTPVENSLLDLWSLADFAIPGILGSRTQFEAMYPDTTESAHELSMITNPVVLRRTVADVAGDLPDRIDIDIPIELTSHLARDYEQIRKITMEEYKVAGALVATGRLQMFCAHPSLQNHDSGSPFWEENTGLVRGGDRVLVTPKIELTVSLIREAFSNNRKVLVFSVFNRCGDLLKQELGDQNNLFWDSINGSTPQEDRQTLIDTFSLHKGNACLVLNPRAAGAGLNITAATVVIHFTQVWNPALEAQASARAHRRGQNEPVTIYHLYYEDTVEAIMIERSRWKRELGNDAVPVATRDQIDIKRALEISPENNHA